MSEKDRRNEQNEEAQDPQGTPFRLTQDEQQDERNPLIEHREEAPREGESPERPPREDPPTPDEAEVTPREWHQVPNPDGQAGIPWEEMRKGMKPDSNQTAEERLWDDRGASEPLQVDHPKKTWDELPEETDPPEEKISSP